MEEDKLQDVITPPPEEVASKKRWLILVIYILYSAANAFQWMEYSIIGNVVMRFYQVNSTAVDWTSIIYMLIYPIIVVPVSYFIEKKGLRFAALYGGVGTALAALVKVFSIGQGQFWVVMLGQAVGSTAQVFVMCLPPKIAAVWFKPSEILFPILLIGSSYRTFLLDFKVLASTACALAVFGTQLGFALGFVLPPTLVKNHDDLSEVGSGLRRLCNLLAGFMVPVVIAILSCFSDKPSTSDKPLNYPQHLRQFKKIFTEHKGFSLHSVAYGINIGVFAAIGTLLNQFILEYFPHAEEDAGRIGLLMVLGGMAGSVLFGLYLDKTHHYKQTTVFIYWMAVVSTVAAMFTLRTHSKTLVYVMFAVVGVFTNAYMPVGFEMAVELTYPADESTTAGILNAMTQAVGVAVTLFLGKFNQSYGAFWALGSQAVLLFAGAVMTTMLPKHMKRQEAQKADKNVLYHLTSCMQDDF